MTSSKFEYEAAAEGDIIAWRGSIRSKSRLPERQSCSVSNLQACKVEEPRIAAKSTLARRQSVRVRSNQSAQTADQRTSEPTNQRPNQRATASLRVRHHQSLALPPTTLFKTLHHPLDFLFLSWTKDISTHISPNMAVKVGIPSEFPLQRSIQ